MNQKTAPDQTAEVPVFRAQSFGHLPAGNYFTAKPVTLVEVEASVECDWSRLVDAVLEKARELMPPSDFIVPQVLTPETTDQSIRSPEEAFAVAAVKLQQLFGLSHSWYQLNSHETSSVGKCVFETDSPVVGHLVVTALRHLFSGVLTESQPEDLKRLNSVLERLTYSGECHYRGIGTLAAQRLGIPFSFAAAVAPTPLIKLGQGKHSKLIWRHMTSETCRIGVTMSQNKHFAWEILNNGGLPVPEQGLAHNFEEAQTAVKRIGWPVVTKPASTDFGMAVTANIADEANLKFGYDQASEHGPVIIEKHVEGTNHRLLVYQGRCLSVVKQTPALVVGDGRSNIGELVEATNAGRTELLSETWKKIKVDEEALSVLDRQGYDLNSVPLSGQVVYLRFHSNLSVGGTMENVTRTTHPDNMRMAVSAAEQLQIDFAGIDFVTTDITKSHLDVGGGIVEINVNPGLVMGEPEGALRELIVSEMMPLPHRGRIPIISVMDSDDNVPFKHGLRDLLHPSQGDCAVTDMDGVFMGSLKIASDVAQVSRRTQIALSDRKAGSAVLTMSPSDFASQGIGVERVTIAVHAPPWNTLPHENFFKMTELADHVLIPHSWLDAYLEARNSDAKIWLMDADGGNQRLLPVDGGEFTGATQPAWTPDGRRLAFVANDARKGKSGKTQIYLVGVDGKNLRQLTDDVGGNHSPAVFANGEHIVYATSRFGDQEIMLMRIDGSAQTRITVSPHTFEVDPVPSPDGQWILISGGREYVASSKTKGSKEGTYGVYAIGWVGFNKEIYYTGKGEAPTPYEPEMVPVFTSATVNVRNPSLLGEL